MHSEKWGINKLREDKRRLAGELLIADGKLEAVKELNREYDAKPIYELDLVQFHNFRAKLWKILEAEG